MASVLRSLIVSVSAETSAYQREMARASRLGTNYFRTIEAGNRTAALGWRSQQAAIEAQQRALTGLTSSVSLYAKTLLSALALGTGVSMVDQWGQMADRIKMATASASEYEEVQRRLLETANRAYRPLAESQELYIRSASALKDLGYATTQVLDITDSFSSLLVTNAASADRARAATDAYSKALATGKINAQSWQSIITAMPSIVDSIAKSTGMASEEVRKLGAEGKLPLDQLTEALLRAQQENARLADGMRVSVADAFAKLTNNVQSYLGQTNDAVGATELFTRAMEALSSNIGLVVNTAVAAGIGALAGKFVQASQAAVTYTRSLIAQRSAAIGSARAAVTATDAHLAYARAQLAAAEAAVASATGMQRLTLVQTELVPKQAAAAAAANAHAAALTNLNRAASFGSGRALLGVLGGPAGLAIVAGTAAASFFLLRDSTEAANRAMADTSEISRILTASLNDLSAGQANSLMRNATDQIKALEEQQVQVRNRIESIRALQRVSNPDDSAYQSREKEYWQLIAQSDGISQEVKKLRDRYAELDAVIAKQGSAPAIIDPESLKKATEMLEKLQQRLVDLSDPSGMSGLKIELIRGGIGEDNPLHNLILDTQSKISELQGKNQKSANDLEKAYQRQLDNLTQQAALFGETTELAKLKYELQTGELKALEDQQKQLLINKATELDGLNARKAVDDLLKSLQTKEEQLTETTRERLRILDAARLSADDYALAMERVSKASVADAPRFSGVDASVGGPSGELIKVAEAQAELDKWRASELERQREFLETRVGYEEEYANRVTEINRQMNERQSELSSAWRTATLSTFSQVTGDAADMLKTLGAESSVLYKVLFLAGKAASIAQAIINTEEAATKALAIDPTGMLAGVTRGLGYASVGIIAGTALTGMAHSGIDNIPTAGTWLLDGGERVLSPEQNVDLTRFLENSKNSSVGVNIGVNVYVDNSGQTQSESQSTAGYELLGQQLMDGYKQITRQVIIEEMRPFGLLGGG